MGNDQKDRKKWQPAPWKIGQSLEKASQPGGQANKEKYRSASNPGGSPSASRRTDGEPFINPYNFVRVERDGKKPDRAPVEHLHEKYHEDCFSGRIECTLDVLTPLFIPDPEQTRQPDAKKAKQMYFNRVNGKPSIPATSLKGMVRSVLETVSNSCFSQLDDGRLDFRDVNISQQLKPAVVLELDEAKKEVRLLILDGLASLPCHYDDERDYCNGLHDQVKFPRCAYGNIKTLSTQNTDDKTTPVRGVVTGHLKRSLHELAACPRGGKPYEVFIKHTGKTMSISNKHDERVFFLSAPSNELEKVTVSYDSVVDFNYVLSEQHKRFEKLHNKAAADKAMRARLNREGPVRVRRHDLVYYYKPKNSLALVLVPRMRYDKSPEELLPPHLRPCSDMQGLCPACRIFGLVSGKSPAFLGKISLSAGELVSKNPDFSKDKLLKILGSPKPTSTNFYLIGEEYENRAPITVQDGGYDRSQTILRGRKFYWHQGDAEHPLDEKRYTTEEDGKFNSRVELLCPPSRFRFSVDFENLTKEELALLVWSLDPGDGMAHKLGMGKPLGLGTVKVAIDPKSSFHVDHDSIKKYYEHIDCALNKQPVDVQGLRDIVEESYGDTCNYRDLVQILRIHPEIAALIKYPSGKRTIRGATQYFGYQWFSDNKEQALLRIDEILEDGKRQTGWKGADA